MYKGNHGYNNSVMAMHPIFVANGPSFKKGLLVEPFENVNIYTLICDILGLSPAPNNGSLEKVCKWAVSGNTTLYKPHFCFLPTTPMSVTTVYSVLPEFCENITCRHNYSSGSRTHNLRAVSYCTNLYFRPPRLPMARPSIIHSF